MDQKYSFSQQQVMGVPFLERQLIEELSSLQHHDSAYHRPHVTTRALSPMKLKNSKGLTWKIELHGHQGYLFDQFTTAIWNKRTDRYGGDLEDRCRFPIEVVETIRDRIGRNFLIVYRYSLKHYMKDPWTGTLEREGYVDGAQAVMSRKGWRWLSA